MEKERRYEFRRDVGGRGGTSKGNKIGSGCFPTLHSTLRPALESEFSFSYPH